MQPKAAPPHSAAARPRARIAGWFAGIFLVFAVIAPHALADFPFPRPPDVEPNVKFWVDVFTAYSNRDFVIHDRDRIWRVYQVLHMPGEGAPDRSEVDAANGGDAFRRAEIHDPADGVEHIGFPATIRANDGRDAFVEFENSFIREGFEADKFERLKMHVRAGRARS